MGDQESDPFLVKDCALAVIATGESAASLLEFRHKLASIHQGCIYFHFWGGRLRPQFSHPEYHNDFAGWAHNSLHDNYLAERLSIIDPTEYNDLEDLRQVLIDVIEERLDEVAIDISKKEDQFRFVRSKTIVFDTPYKFSHPTELLCVLPSFTTSSIFYHFIDARRRTEKGINDLSVWLGNFPEYQSLIDKINGIDPYFASLAEIRSEAIKVITESFAEAQT